MPNRRGDAFIPGYHSGAVATIGALSPRRNVYNVGRIESGSLNRSRIGVDLGVRRFGGRTHMYASRPYALSRRRVPAVPLIVVLIHTVGSVAVGQPSEQTEDDVADRFRTLQQAAGGFDWDREYPHIERALRNIWRQNGWSTASDQFAYNVVREVSAIPPWKFTKRLDLLTERLADRYGMGDQNTARFKGMIVGEIGGILARNASALFEGASEALSARAHGEPYTAEQIAEWIKQSAPLRAEADLAYDRLLKQLKPMLGKPGRRLLEQDATAHRKRMKRFDEMTESWIQGQWQPSDWGLQDDPIQAATLDALDGEDPDAPGRLGPGGEARAKKLPRWQAHKPLTWYAYVLHFRKRYDLDVGQMVAAESIHDELLERAKAYVRAHVDEFEAIEPGHRARHEAYEPIRGMFRELLERLDAIPTSAQRARGES